ncbi:MAG: GntR family transcriptional regulator [Oscillospiraceae bacterium]|nr:GntR family transcriptional regulator [Oscillospiraceae bacterium]
MNTATTVYEDLRAKIINGTIAASADLTETELASNYGVSRNTVKKALLMLAGEHFITMEPNKGARVKTYSVGEVLEHLEVRAVLEGLIVRLAAESISKDDIARLGEALENMKRFQQERKIVEYSQQNQVFHKIIHAACPNKTLVAFTEEIKARIRKYNTKTNLVPGRAENSVKEHEAILNAIIAADFESAEAYMITHIRNVRETFGQNYHYLI